MITRCAILVVASATDPLAEDLLVALRTLLLRNLPGVYFREERHVASDRHLIQEILRSWCDEEDIDLVLTIGGTFPAPGHSLEEITPEATAGVIERAFSSLPETMRSAAAVDDPMALLDRGIAGIRTRTLIVNLPGFAHLACIFLEAIIDLIEPILVRLRPFSVAIQPPTQRDLTQPSKRGGLNADEFAAFLDRRTQEG